MKKVKNFLNRGISSIWAIIIIIVIGVVAAGSILTYQRYWQPSQLEEQQDETADWETYRNEEYGFEFKYPSEINDSNVKISYSGPGESIDKSVSFAAMFLYAADKDVAYIVSVSDNSFNLSLEEWIKKHEACGFRKGNDLDINKVNLKNISLNGEGAVRINDLGGCVTGGGFAGDVVYVSKNSKVYSIGYYGEGGWGEASREILDKIISSFKFIKAIDVSYIADNFCKNNDQTLAYSSLLNYDEDEDMEILVMCDMGYSPWESGREGYFDVFVLKEKDNRHQSIWNLYTGDENDLNFRNVYQPKVVDIDKDGIDEIILVGSNHGGTCTGSWTKVRIYSWNDEYFDEDFLWGYSNYININSPNCDYKIIKGSDDVCNSSLMEGICFSDNLNAEKYKPFKDYLDANIEEIKNRELEE